jgi:prepilin-type N-terminal cleavage/methylation domain-containing protein
MAAIHQPEKCRSHPCHQEGFTLVELLMTLTVLAIVMGAISQMFIASLRTASASALRTDAMSLAERDIEAMRAIPYDQLGFNANQAGYSSIFVDSTGTYATVQVPQPQLSPSTQTVALGGRSFTLDRAIYWVGGDRANTANYREAYKQTTVVVSWRDPTGMHQVRQQGIIYTGGQGAYVGPQGGGVTTTTVPAGAPTRPDLTAALDSINPSTTINLSWTVGADHWQVQYSTDNFVTANVLATGVTATTYQVTGRAPSSVYQFRVGAYAANGAGPAWSDIVTQTTAPGSGGATCAVTSVTVTPTSIARAAGLQSLSGNISVSVITSGSCTSVSARYTPTTTPARVMLTPNAGYTNWTGTLNGTATNWALGDHEITIWNELTTTPLNSTGGVTVTP